VGRKHRLNNWRSGFAAVLLCGCVVGCKSDDGARREQQRRELLRGQDLDKERQARFDKERYTDPQGNLLASDTTVAGVVLPRGFRTKFTFESEWYYDGALPVDKLAQYMDKAMQGASIERPNADSIQFSRPYSGERPGVQVTISPLPGRADWSRMHILSLRPPSPSVATAEQIQAEFARRAAMAR
jgi:hypothetical protein